MGHTNVIRRLLLGLALAVGACGDSSSAESACSSCPSAAKEICEQGVQSCLDVGGPFVDECINAITRACRGE